MTDMRPLTEDEERDYLNGFRTFPGAMETPEGVQVPILCPDCYEAAMEARRMFHDPDGQHGDSDTMRTLAAQDVLSGESRCSAHRED